MRNRGAVRVTRELSSLCKGHGRKAQQGRDTELALFGKKASRLPQPTSCKSGVTPQIEITPRGRKVLGPLPEKEKKKKKTNPPKPRLVPFEHEDPDPTTPRFSILFPAPSPRGPRAPGGPRVGTRWTRRPTFWNVRCQAGKGPTPPQQLSCNPSLLPVKRISPGAGPPPSPRFWNAAWGGGVEGGTGQG